MNQPLPAVAVSEARRDIHELLTALPAWDADKVRDALTRFERVHRDQILTTEAANLRARCPHHGDADPCLIDCQCPAADVLLAARTAPQEQQDGAR